LNNLPYLDNEISSNKLVPRVKARRTGDYDFELIQQDGTTEQVKAKRSFPTQSDDGNYVWGIVFIDGRTRYYEAYLDSTKFWVM
jgi:hypothetical protein